MKGYLTTCDGAQFELPTLLKWEFSYTGSVPCDSFTLRCAYEPAMAEVLRRAVRFTAREDGTVEFAGVVDECGVTCDEKGLQLEVSGRGMAALLLDNEAESVSYQWATMEEILKNHVTPYGIVCMGYDAVTAAARYRVANGSSQWKALNDFATLHGGIAPYFDKTGALEVKKNRKAARVSIDAKTPVTALSYRTERGTLSGGELYAAGAALDGADGAMEYAEREGLLQTAEGEGLARREKLFSRCPVSVSTALRREAIAALARINADSFTLDAINSTLSGCGIKALAEETEKKGTVKVWFPNTVGVPDEFSQVESIILDIIPCHLLVEFYFRYLTWLECERVGFTWQSVEDAHHTWESFEKAVPEEE